MPDETRPPERSADDVGDQGVSLVSQVAEWRGKPAQAAREDLTRLVGEQGERAVPILQQLALEDDPLALEAARALGIVRSVSAASALAAVASVSTRREVQKEARRALHRLRSEGIAPRPEARVAEEAGRPAFDYYRAVVSPIDSKGLRLLHIGLSEAFGALRVFTVLWSSYDGIVEVWNDERSKAEFADEVAKTARDMHFQFIEVPPEYALDLLREAFQRNKATGSGAPMEYLVWQKALGGGNLEAFRPLIYTEVPSAEVRLRPEYLETSAELLTLRDFSGWTFGEQDLRSLATEMLGAESSTLVLSEHAVAERRQRILKTALETALAGERRAIFKRMMEEMAYFLLHTERPRRARQALAVAIALEAASQTSPAAVPFLAEMMQRTFAEAARLGRSGSPTHQASRAGRRFTIEQGTHPPKPS